MSESSKALLTTDVLKQISSHLSWRTECKDKEYEVKISTDDKSGKDIIEVYPYITCFPNIHERKESDRRGVAYHVIRNHFPDLLEDSTDAIVKVKSDTLVHGCYIYKKYKLTNRRKWEKLS